MSPQSQRLEKFDLLRGRVPAERGIPEEGLKPRLFVDLCCGLLLRELELLRVLAYQPAVEDDLHSEGCQVDVP